MDKICRNCRYFEALYYECRAHPPVAREDPPFHRFPKVGEAGWCGDWQAKETPRRTAPTPTKAIVPVSDEFDLFWAEVPNKIGKKAAQKAFNSAVDRPPIDDLLEALRKAKRSPQWLKDNGQFIPHPATWLNRGQWADVPVETKPSVFEEFLARGGDDDGCDRLE